MKNLICFETVRPTKQFFELSGQLKNKDYQIFVFIDDNNYNIEFDYDPEIKVIKINNEECANAGYKGLVSYFKDSSCAKDKALYYVIKNSNELDYDYVWFIEDDCYIPSKYTIPNIDAKYKNENIDLLCKEHMIYKDKKLKGWHWDLVYDNCSLSLPFAKGLQCAKRCSRKYIQTIEDYVNTYGKVFYNEAFFNTLCLHYDLDIKTIKELKTLKWETDHIWKFDDIKTTNIYHPIKDINIQYSYWNKSQI